MDIEHLLDRLRAISDTELRDALDAHNLSISDEKFGTAFMCLAASHDLGKPDFPVQGPPDVPGLKLKGMRKKASVVFMVFTALCYMRSAHLERGLDGAPESSVLRAFRDIYRAGSIRRGEDTLVQHIRNSVAHGTFSLGLTLEVTFIDENWQETIPLAQLMELCEHVHRLYHAAFHQVIPCPPHWSRYRKW